MLKIGLVGVGGISGAHIPAWNAMEDTTLTAMIIPELSEPPVRTLGATIPENESHIFR